MSSSPLVVVEHLTKRYGPRSAVRGISFEIAAGEIVGLLGPNGSGKTTILRILAGYLAPSGGIARVDGEDVASGSLALRAKVGYVPEDAPLYDYMRVEEFLRFTAAIKGLARHAIAGVVDEVSTRLGLTGVSRMLIGKLSRGYRQRVALAHGLIHAPKLLILDEPTNGLDPQQIIEMRELVGALAGRQTVLMASHVLTEIERTADRALILLDGELLAERAVKPSADALRLKLRVRGPTADVGRAIAAVPGVRRAEPEPPTAADAAVGWQVEAERRPGLAEAVVAALARAGLPPAEVSESPIDLEQAFLETTRRARVEEAG